MQGRRLIALCMVCAYLILPLDSFASLLDPAPAQLAACPQSHASPKSGASLQEPAAALDLASHCPCPDGHGSDGCNHQSCSCCSYSCCAPFPARFAWLAPQPMVSFSLLESCMPFPKVYLPIFVLPQNRDQLPTERPTPTEPSTS